MMMVGRGTGITETEVCCVTTLPEASVRTAVRLYVPADRYTCVTVAFVLTAPRSWSVPSPQVTVRLRTAPAPVGTVTAKVNVAGRPALGGVVGGVITRPGATATFTFTV